MANLRSDARGSPRIRREQVSPTPAHLTGPALAIAATAGLATVALIDLNLPLVLVIGIVVLVIAVGASIAGRTTASLVAGITLLLARVYLPGERVRLYAPEIGSYLEAEIVRIGLMNATLATPGGLLIVANTRLLRSAPDDPATEKQSSGLDSS